MITFSIDQAADYILEWLNFHLIHEMLENSEELPRAHVDVFRLLVLFA